MPIIDINVRFGAYPARHRTSSFEQVSADAERLGVDMSCVCCTTGIYYIDREGNRQTVAAASAKPKRLVPVATINPATAFDVKSAIEEIAAPATFKMVRFFPDDQGWPIDFSPFAQCVKILSEKRMPAMISCTRRGDATLLARAVANTSGGETPLVLEGVTAANLAEVLSAMRDCPSLLVEMHAVVFADGLRMIRDAVGADRIVFGSGTSALSLGGALSYIKGSTLGDEDKAKVLGGNAARVLGL
jgi:predicted TIM-barrel fold metal-dependent hydrolase